MSADQHNAPPSRQDRRFGRRKPRPEHIARALAFGSFWTGVIPAHPAAQDNLALLRGGWKMLGNNIAGDCVAVTWANFRRLVTAVLGGREVYPTQDQVWAIYRTQNPDFDPNAGADTNGPGSPADQGMDIQTLLEYLVAYGGPDGVKAVAFAKVDHTNPTEVEAAIAIFGGLWTGVVVQDAQQDQFSQGKPWDWVSGSPTEGGHSILSGGYDTAGLKDITWAREISLTLHYLAKGVEELWLVIWPEHLGTRAFLQGVDQAALAAAYTAVTHRPAPFQPTPQPTPTPGPGPNPGPSPDPVDPGVDADMAFIAAFEPFAEQRHQGAARAAVQAYRVWRAKRGY